MNCRLVQMASIVTVLLLTLVGSGGGVAHGDEPVLMPLESGQRESSPRQHQDGHAPSSRQVSEPGLLHSVNDLPPTSDGRSLVEMLEGMLPESGLAGPLSAAVTIGVVSLAPAALLMTTCFVRFSVVLSLVRQGLGTQGMPSNQIVASLALFLSAVVMWPVWSQAWTAGVEPYQAGELALPAALDEGSLPVRRWMAGQIEAAGNRETVLMFLQRHPSAESGVATYDDVPVEALLPAFLVSELETAFKLGVRLLIPFLLIDLVVATLVVSSGLVMLPPTIVSFPLKILVFVMADGWTLVVTSLLNGVSPAGS